MLWVFHLIKYILCFLLWYLSVILKLPATSKGHFKRNARNCNSPYVMIFRYEEQKRSGQGSFGLASDINLDLFELTDFLNDYSDKLSFRSSLDKEWSNNKGIKIDSFAFSEAKDNNSNAYDLYEWMKRKKRLRLRTIRPKVDDLLTSKNIIGKVYSHL